MRNRFIVAFCLGLAAAGMVFAQVKSVTNADLEKFRQQRLAAEKDYRENYARLGFPSPEELKLQIEKERAQREKLAEKLRAERLERERFEAELAASETDNAYQSQRTEIVYKTQYVPAYPIIGYYDFYYPRRRLHYPYRYFPHKYFWQTGIQPRVPGFVKPPATIYWPIKPRF